jgi:23S rRNA pseudouridine1911/1915/1917 synthase
VSPIHRFTVPESLAETRLDRCVADLHGQWSRSRVHRLIDDGRVLVNGAAAKPATLAAAGDLIEVDEPPPRRLDLAAEDIPLVILHEDEELLVLDKPPGLVIHPAAGRRSGTLVNALLQHCGELSGIGGVERPGIVHRLDKETSGCLVVAKNDETHLALSTQFATRKVEKIYQAIVCGELPREQGEIRAAIARHPSHRKRMAVDDDAGREARTGYRVLERLRGTTLVEAVLHTGRTHQIRVHFQFLGFPVVGDATYGNRQNQRLEELTGYRAPRMMLHAGRLAFIHPRTAKRLSCEAPRPEDFQDALAALR